MGVQITVDDFKNHFYRDFDFACNQADLTKIIDKDIEKAMAEAKLLFNPDLFEDDETANLAFLYLTAFYLVLDIKNSTSGLNSTYSGIVASKSVDNVSESYFIPQWLSTNPSFSIFMSNGYGQKYLSILYPRIIGAMYLSPGATTID